MESNIKEIKFMALVKSVNSKALVSLDKSYQVLLQGEDSRIAELISAPADQEVEVIIRYPSEELG